MARLTLPDTGRITICSAMKANTFALAVGLGDGTWTTPPDVASNATALVNPQAMVRSTQVDYVTPNNSTGTIETSDGSKWDVSVSPTRYLYLRFVLGFTDGSSLTLREKAVYLNPTYAGGVPGGQNYIAWGSVTAAGQMLALAYFAPIPRAGIRQTFAEVLTF